MGSKGNRQQSVESRGLLCKDNCSSSCDCQWEIRFGYGVAVSLAILEAKRLFLLVLEMFIEWQVIKFVGGSQPVLLTFVDIAIGFPSALAIIHFFRKSQLHKKIMKILSLIIGICVIFNILTILSIAINVIARPQSVAQLFNNSMHLYASRSSVKYAIDEIQLSLECCGYYRYTNWFLFDWQRVNFIKGRDDGNLLDDVPEEFQLRAVPFSCCDIYAMVPCIHSDFSNDDKEMSINVRGCAPGLHNMVFRLLICAYAMTCMLVLTQILLAYLLLKISRQVVDWQVVQACSCDSEPDIVNYKKKRNSDLKSCNSQLSIASNSRRELLPKCNNKSLLSSNKKLSANASKNSRVQSGNLTSSMFTSSCDSSSSSSSSSTTDLCTLNYQGAAAKIKPSTHSEHKLPEKQQCLPSK